MSTVNLTEAIIRYRDRKLRDAELLEADLLSSGIEFVPPDERQALIAARARFQFPLNLGDCFAYALAKAKGLTLLALDRDFRGVDVPVMLPPVV